MQILGVDKIHLDRIQGQLTSALGDDSGKKFRVLQQAIDQLVRDKSLSRDLAPPVGPQTDELKPQDIERLVGSPSQPCCVTSVNKEENFADSMCILQAVQAKTVTTYHPDSRLDAMQHGSWQAKDAYQLASEGPKQRTPVFSQGDLAKTMIHGG